MDLLPAGKAREGIGEWARGEWPEGGAGKWSKFQIGADLGG